MKKICITCRTEKDINDFYLDKKRGFYQSYCKICSNKRSTAYQKENPEKSRETRIKRREKNRETMNAYQREYRQKNLDAVREYDRKRGKEKRHRLQNEYSKLKRKTDIDFKTLCSLRSRHSNIISNQASKKTTYDLVGCDIETYKKHIALKFKIGMSWENYGEWVIDHISPLSAFDLTKTEDQRKCFHYTNTQPLWMQENLIKGNKICG